MVLFGVEDLERLIDVGLGVRLDLLGRELRARGVAPRGVADERGAVADDERDPVSQVLELPELAQRDGMPQVDVGSRGVHAQLDVQGLAALQLLEQGGFGHDLRRAGFDDVQLFFGSEHRSAFPCLLCFHVPFHALGALGSGAAHRRAGASCRCAF